MGLDNHAAACFPFNCFPCPWNAEPTGIKMHPEWIAGQRMYLNKVAKDGPLPKDDGREVAKGLQSAWQAGTSEGAAQFLVYREMYCSKGNPLKSFPPLSWSFWIYKHTRASLPSIMTRPRGFFPWRNGRLMHPNCEHWKLIHIRVPTNVWVC